MAAIQFSTESIDYIQRNNYTPPPLIGRFAMTSAPLPLRRIWQVRSIGQREKGTRANRPEPQPRPSSNPEQGRFSAAIANQAQLPSEDILTGLSGFHVPMVFQVNGRTDGVSISLGTWSQAERENASAAVLNSRLQMVGAVLRSLYAAVDLVPAQDMQTPAFPLAGLVLGMPTAKPANPQDGALPIDRLIRSMYGSNWTALVLAEPVSAHSTSEMRHQVLNEMRAIETAANATRTPSPLALHYKDLLEVTLDALSRAQAVGAWRTAVYLMGDESSYYRLASVWQSIFSGEASAPEPVRVYSMHEAADLASSWAMPDLPGAPGPGLYRLPFAYQTLLTSSQLAAYVQLPALETSGFSIQLIADYDVVPRPVPQGALVALGKVVDRARPTELSYTASLNDLNRHALVAGVTGSGKTNTLFHILRQLWQWRIPYLVLEPAKTEYRSLLVDPAVNQDLRIFTLGEEQVSPLRINPFEVENGVSVATHIDLLLSVFNASFGMWNPLPQVLERCIHAIYRDYGWDPVRGSNRRLDRAARSYSEEAFPTVTDLHDKVTEVVDRLGWEDKIASDVKASLTTRLNSLRVGGKGVMLDTQRSIPTTELFSAPTIIELEAIGDDDEKSFLMGLILIRLYEHLRATGSIEGTGLKHLVVIEEAHRLLANMPPSTNSEQANVRGKAVETFANMLSEIRAYGEGFLVAEQIPSKLALDIIKNTNLKIVHRVVAGDDRQVLGLTMNMDETQRDMISTLRTGQAAVYAEGDDRPILVEIPYDKIVVPKEMSTKAGSDRTVAEHMANFRRQPALATRFVPFDPCPQTCGEPYRYCEEAKVLTAQPEFQNLFAKLGLALVLPGGAIHETAGMLADYATARLPSEMPLRPALGCVTLNAVRWYLAYFGRKYGWSYQTVEAMRRPLAEAMLKVLPPLAEPGASPPQPGNELEEFRRIYRQACHRNHDPFPLCSRACPDGQCIFRYNADLLLQDRHLKEEFDAGMQHATEGEWSDLAGVDQAIGRMVGFEVDPDMQRSAGLCFGFHQIAYNPFLLEWGRQRALVLFVKGMDVRWGRENNP